MPVYILDMLELPAEIKSAFETGEFSIRQTSGSLNGIWSVLTKFLHFFFTFVDSRQQRILYFSGSMHACRNIHETWRVGLYIKT
jgi:hypothetical protein